MKHNLFLSIFDPYKNSSAIFLSSLPFPCCHKFFDMDQHAKQLHTMILPPPCLTVRFIWYGMVSSCQCQLLTVSLTSIEFGIDIAGIAFITVAMYPTFLFIPKEALFWAKDVSAPISTPLRSYNCLCSIIITTD